MMQTLVFGRLVWAWILLSALSGSGTGCDRRIASGTGAEEPRIDVRVGGTVAVSLASNPSTGYRWEWSNRPSARHVDTSGWSFDAERPGVPGAGGKERWIFKGILKGMDTVRLEYKRPWEKVPAVRDTAIVIRVR